MGKGGLKLVFLTALLTLLATSAVWIGAYLLAVKPNVDKRLKEKECKDGPTSRTPAPVQEPGWPAVQCGDQCHLELVESMPLGLEFPANETLRLRSTQEVWLEMLDKAQHSVDLTAMYWTLLAEHTGDGFVWDPSAQAGTDVFNKITETAKRGVRVRIAQDGSRSVPVESAAWAQQGLAELRSLNFTRFGGGGILHTKAWVVDGRHAYLGSANMDWRSLTQVKEMGVYVRDCPCLANDMLNQFEVNWYMGVPDQPLPKPWPRAMRPRFNADQPMTVRTADGDNLLAYLTSSPPSLAPAGRADDAGSIVRVIDEAQQFIYISVMDYAPFSLYNGAMNFYWPLIDDALRRAAFDRRVRVHLLMSSWDHTRAALLAHLRSLQALNSQLPCLWDSELRKCRPGTKGELRVRLFRVPAYQGGNVTIPYGRVNHAKFMVTEKTALIGTSNWSADYFLNTGGASLVVRSAATNAQQHQQEHEQQQANAASNALHDQVRHVFERDWNSEHAQELPAERSGALSQ